MTPWEQEANLNFREHQVDKIIENTASYNKKQTSGVVRQIKLQWFKHRNRSTVGISNADLQEASSHLKPLFTKNK